MSDNPFSKFSIEEILYVMGEEIKKLSVPQTVEDLIEYASITDNYAQILSNYSQNQLGEVEEIKPLENLSNLYGILAKTSFEYGRQGTPEEISEHVKDISSYIISKSGVISDKPNEELSLYEKLYDKYMDSYMRFFSNPEIDISRVLAISILGSYLLGDIYESSIPEEMLNEFKSENGNYQEIKDLLEARPDNEPIRKKLGLNTFDYQAQAIREDILTPQKEFLDVLYDMIGLIPDPELVQ